MSVDLEALQSKKVVECNNCKEIIERIVSKTENLSGNRLGYFFCCDKCGYKYPYMTITEEGQRLLGTLNSIKKDICKFPELTKQLHFKLKKVLVDYQKEVGHLYTEEDVLK